MRFAFRVDSSARIGTGHLVRCLTLAETLRSRGAEAIFLCRQLDGAATSRVENSGFEVRYLDDSLTEGYSSEHNDAIETLKLMHECSLTRVIVDHYDLSIEWETIVAAMIEDLIVIDDFTHRQHQCDLLINQNLLLTQAQSYAGSLPDSTRALLGPRYALLQPDFAAIRSLRATEILDVKRIVVFMGGSDSENSTEIVLRHLINMGLDAIAIDVVIGSSNPHRSNILAAFQSHRSMTFHFDLPSLAPLLASSDLAIGAGGTSNWERMCLGVPSLVLVIAENQREICVELAQAGLIDYVGNFHQISEINFQNAVSKLIADRNRRSRYALQGQITVDGLGAKRVAEALLPSDRALLTLRKCQADDVVSYFNWVNDPSVRESSLETDPITWIEHEAWFKTRINDPMCRMYLLCIDNLPVGQIRFQKVNNNWSINYSIDELVRGRGWGRFLVEQGIVAMRSSTMGNVVANIKVTNLASRKIFEKLGFSRGSQSDSAVDQFVLML